MKKFELSIPKPCHENWMAMTPEDKGRFCGSCQKTVIDFSVMNDRQLAQFFKQPVGSVCGRFNGDQLERVIEVPKKRIPWVRYFFTIALPAFLLSKKATAQGEVKVTGKIAKCEKSVVKGDTIIRPFVAVEPEPPAMMLGEIATTSLKKPDTNNIVKGRVIDEGGNPILYASIQVENTQQYSITDSQGYFTLQTKKPAGQIQITSVGYEPKQVSYQKERFLSVTLQSRGNMDIMGAIVVMPAKKKKPTPKLSAMKNDTALSKFSVFPNPVSSTSSFTIQTKGLEDGRYSLSILTTTGELVRLKEVTITKKAALNYDLNNVAAGPYFIRLTNRENNKSFTEILLVK